LDVIITLKVDDKYQPIENSIKSKVSQKVLEYFNVDNNDFGKEFNPQELLYKVFEVEEVRYATVDNIKDSIKLNFNEISQLNNYTLNISYV
jgi:predicted transcriptional regulator